MCAVFAHLGLWNGQDNGLTDQDIGELRAQLEAGRDARHTACLVLAPEPPQRLAAVVDFCVNLGAGRLQTATLRRRINQRDWAEAAREMCRWVHGGGRVLPGLQARPEIAAQWLWRDAAPPNR